MPNVCTRSSTLLVETPSRYASATTAVSVFFARRRGSSNQVGKKLPWLGFGICRPALRIIVDSRLQTVSKTGAHLRVLPRRSEEVESGLNLLIQVAKRRIGVRLRLVTSVHRFRVRFPCATAKRNLNASRVLPHGTAAAGPVPSVLLVP